MFNFHVSGAYSCLFLIPFLIGAAICLFAGLAAGIYIVAWISDLIIDRLVRVFNVYDAVVATGRQRIRERRLKRDQANS